MWVLNNTPRLYRVYVRIDGRGFHVQLTPKVKKDVDRATFEALKGNLYIKDICGEFGKNGIVFSDDLPKSEPIEVVEAEKVESSEDITEVKTPPKRRRRKPKKEDDFFGEE